MTSNDNGIMMLFHLVLYNNTATGINIWSITSCRSCTYCLYSLVALTIQIHSIGSEIVDILLVSVRFMHLSFACGTVKVTTDSLSQS